MNTPDELRALSARLMFLSDDPVAQQTAGALEVHAYLLDDGVRVPAGRTAEEVHCAESLLRMKS